MTRREVTLTEYTCDGCGRTAVVDVEADGLPTGFHLSVTEVTGAGADGGDVYACRKSCVLKAVSVAGVDEDRR